MQAVETVFMADTERKIEKLHMFQKAKVKIGISPIGWTNDDLPELGNHISFERCISEMEEAGYEGCEIGNKFPKDPIELKERLAEHGLVACNEWFPTYFTSHPYEYTLELFKKQCQKMKAVNGRIIGASEQGNSIQTKKIPIFGEDKPVYSSEEWRIILKGYNEMGKIARENGLWFSVHHHMGTGIQTEEEIDRLMEYSDPEYVFLVFCIGHVCCAGIDPERLLKKYVNRVRHVHLKDVRREVREQAITQNMSFLDAVREGVFTIPGDGCVDYDPLFRILNENAYEGFLLVEAEQDPIKAEPLTYAKRARNYVRKHTGL